MSEEPIQIAEARRPITSASNFYRRRACPGSERMEKAAPEEPTSADAEEGTAGHAYWQEAFTQGVNETLIPKELRWEVEWMVKETERLLMEVFKGAPHEVHWEIPLTFNGGVIGHADFVAVGGTVGLVIDGKLGRKKVARASQNDQLLCYAVGVGESHILTKLYAGILQPRLCREDAEQRATLATFDEKAIYEDGPKEIERVMGVCREESAPLAVGDHCFYCRARTTCPEAMKKLRDLAGAEDWKKLTAEKKAEILRDCGIVARFIDSWKRKAIEELTENPTAIPGWKLKPGNEVRKITNAVAAFGAVKHVLEADEFIACCNGKISELDEAYRAKTEKKKAEAGEELEGMLKEVGALKRERNKPSLVEDA